MSGARRSQDVNAPRPALKVIGFRVEGVPPSPDQVHGLADSTEGGGSPDPVIIPPTLKDHGSNPDSPKRTSTVPTYMLERQLQDLRDVLKSPALLPLPSDVDTENRLYSSASLPPFTDKGHTIRQVASSSGDETSPRVDPSTGKVIHSPLKPRRDQPLSSSYKMPSYMSAQNWRRTEPAPLSATFTQGSRFPEAMERHQHSVRPIKVHMRATNSDGSKIISPGDAAHDFGTPRRQSGFQIQKTEEVAPMPESPFANRHSHPLTSDLTSVAEEPSAEENQPQKSFSQLSMPTQTPSESGLTHGASKDSASSAASRSIAMPARKTTPERSREEKKPGGEKPKEKTAGGEKPKEKAAGEKPKEKEGAKKESSQAGEAEEKKRSTKAERRALQERQRAEKAAAKEGQGPAKKPAQEATKKLPAQQQASQPKTSPSPGVQQPAQAAKATGKTAKQGRRVTTGATSEMFAHLQQYKKINIENLFEQFPKAGELHPVILQLGLKIANGEISGGNSRCLAMLNAFKTFILDYHIPEKKELARDLMGHLNTCIHFLVQCRPMSISMGTAIKNLKLKITQVPPSMEAEEAKEMLINEIDTFVQEKITYADRSVADLAQSKIENKDVVLTFAYSSAVFNTFLAARQAGKRFRIIVVDSRPHYEGKTMMTQLAAVGIPCTYLNLNAICFIMKEVTKVFMGASGALSNGTILGRTGSASVALAAHALQRPVIVCCETLKFADKVQLDSITGNELGDPQLLADVQDRPDLEHLKGWSEEPQLELLNLMYDATPSKFVSMLVTEVGAIPPTSIPVILREYRAEPRM